MRRLLGENLKKSYNILAHLSRRLKGELIVYQSSYHLCVTIFKLEYLSNQWANHNEILSEPSLGWGKAALGFGPDLI